VTKGLNPVLNARVIVNLQVEDEDGRIVEDGRTLQLLDNGYGEPDMTRGDGIYSRFITSYPSSGKYIYKVMIDDNYGEASTVTTGEPTVYKPERVGITPAVDHTFLLLEIELNRLVSSNII